MKGPLMLILGVLLLTQAGWREEFATPDPSGEIPAGWKYEDGPLGVADIRFGFVEAEGAEDGKALRIDSESASGVILTDAYRHVDLAATPVLSWRWRVIRPTESTTEDDQSIVVYFGAIDWWVNKSVGYRWETAIPAGTTGNVSYGAGFVKVRYQVLRDASTPAGEWVTEYRNVRDDFNAAYRYVPKEFAVSVGANSQNTGSHSIAEIDYIEFISEAEAAERQAADHQAAKEE